MGISGPLLRGWRHMPVLACARSRKPRLSFAVAWFMHSRSKRRQRLPPFLVGGDAGPPVTNIPQQALAGNDTTVFLEEPSRARGSAFSACT